MNCYGLERLTRRTSAAPWATSLKVISIISTVLIPTIVWVVMLPWNDDLDWGVRVAILESPVLLLGTCALFTVRDYEVADGEVNVQRLLWRTRIPLHSLKNAEWHPGSFDWVWRTFGNGGLFLFSGWFYQKSLGAFRSLATRTTDAVIPTFDGRNSWLSPPTIQRDSSLQLRATKPLSRPLFGSFFKS